MLLIVLGDACGGEDFVFARVPLGVPTHLVNMSIKPQQKWVAAAFCQRQMKRLVTTRKIFHVILGALDDGKRFQHALKILRIRIHDGQTRHLRLHHEADVNEFKWRGTLCDVLIVGMDVLTHERIWAAMFEASHAQRDRELIMEAIACVDTAVWDLNGKALGASVHRLMGGYRDRIPITSIGGYYQEGRTLDDLAREMQWLQSEGMAGVKFKVGALTPEEDFSRVEAARKAGSRMV